ncbi:MAG TPA: quinone-dependent dihydroorotate dehydrogenase [Candidatus Anammoximicrobium sp.]|nr:quinone-dependent dihydroorotate dehydrogenase [Candidatus Anammoximicrobium sp.]
MNLYRLILRPLLFRLDAEAAHRRAVAACRVAGALPLVPTLARACLNFTAPELQTEVAGLRVENPIGLAAGWDKSGHAVRMLDHLGFGFAEIGSISARPSAGNPRPRLFRLPADRAIVVNYGVPNDGAEVVARRLTAYSPRVPLGVNIVKTNDGPDAPLCCDEDIFADFERSASLLHSHAGYLALSLNCPNMKVGGDFFARPGNITRLLERLRNLQVQCPVFLKIGPSLNPADHERWIEEAGDFDFVRGFIFNLAPGKPDTLRLSTPRAVWEQMPGAVSGKPVESLINNCIRELYRRLPPGRFAIIGAGGVFSAEDAYRKIRLGASLVQIYTALIYEGPGIVKRINRGLCELLARDGVKHVSEAVGRDA